MIELEIPGRGTIRLEHLVSDVNGTLAVDGILVDGVEAMLAEVGDVLHVHLLTADTHGRQADIDRQLNLKGTRIPPGDEAGAKAAYVQRLGAETVFALGQGANDAGMLKVAGLGVAVQSEEGLAVETLMAADLVVPNTLSALRLLLSPTRIKASLRR